MAGVGGVYHLEPRLALLEAVVGQRRGGRSTTSGGSLDERGHQRSRVREGTQPNRVRRSPWRLHPRSPPRVAAPRSSRGRSPDLAHPLSPPRKVTLTTKGSHCHQLCARHLVVPEALARIKSVGDFSLQVLPPVGASGCAVRWQQALPSVTVQGGAWIVLRGSSHRACPMSINGRSDSIAVATRRRLTAERHRFWCGPGSDHVMRPTRSPMCELRCRRCGRAGHPHRGAVRPAPRPAAPSQASSGPLASAGTRRCPTTAARQPLAYDGRRSTT
jgi:hypothetical protein